MAFIIESDEAVRDSLHALVAAHGWRCRAFPDGESFLAVEEPGMSGFVIVDQSLGGIGYERLLRELRARNSALPVIVVTPRDDAKVHARLRREGARAVLVRPFTKDDLDEAIRAAFDDDAPTRRGDPLAGSFRAGI